MQDSNNITSELSNLDTRPCLGLSFQQYPFPAKLVMRLLLAWFNSPLVPFDIFLKILEKVERKAISKSDLVELCEKLEESSKKVESKAIEKKIMSWNNYTSLNDTDVEFLHNKYPELDLHRKIGLTPSKIAKELGQRVKGQTTAVLELSLHLYEYCIYWNQLDSGEENLIKPHCSPLVLGDSGCGKTYTITSAAHILEAGFINIDCSMLVTEGYVGAKLYTELKLQYDKLPEAIRESGRIIVFLDEFDKLASNDLNIKTNTFNELLVLLNDNTSSISTRESYDQFAPKTDLDIHCFCFLLGGAFTGIQSQEKAPIGFSNTSLNQRISNDDLVKYGIPKEVVGRIGRIIEFNKLKKHDLVDILQNGLDSPLNYYRNFFKYHNVELKLGQQELEIIAEQAIKQRVGARGLKTVLAKYLRNRMLEIHE